MEQWLDRYRGLLFFTLIALTLVGIVVFQLLRPEPAEIILTSPTPSPLPQSTATPRLLRVYISGAVQHPDVYTLSLNSIAKDAVVAAGGATDDADLDRINLAMPLADGQHIHVPRLGEEALPADVSSGSPATTGKVNINRAGVAELDTLPGIGPSIAQRICDYRELHGPFARIEDIMEVSGIGQVTFERIRELITTD